MIVTDERIFFCCIDSRKQSTPTVNGEPHPHPFMNTDTDKPPCHEDPSSQSETYDKSQDLKPARHFDSTASAFRAGREDAVKKAREKAPQLKDAVANTLHGAVYGLTYGACFAGAFANELVPKLVKETVESGVKKGVWDGQSAGEKIKASTGAILSDIADPMQGEEEGGSNELRAPA